MEDQIISPPAWGKDTLSSFIQQALKNTFASFHNYKEQYLILEEIHSIFEVFNKNMIADTKLLTQFFLFRSHCAYLGGVRLALSGQVAESYMVLRGCIESALYGLFLYNNPSLMEIWFKRHNDENSKQKVKNLFKIIEMFKLLKDNNEEIYRISKQLYELTIDYGAHPNERAFTSNMEIKRSVGKSKIIMSFLNTDRIPLLFCITTTMQTGLCSLYIFQIIFKDRFNILGLSDRMDKLKKLLQ